MRIESFRARGYRSLRDVRIDGLGAFNVFYGPNGSGKSNILAALQTWLQLIRIELGPIEPTALLPTADALAPQQRLERLRGSRALLEEGAPVSGQDFALHEKVPRMTLGGTLVDVGPGISRAEITLQLDATLLDRPTLHRVSITVDGLPLEHDVQLTDQQRTVLAALQSVDWDRKLTLVPADRMPRTELPQGRPPEDAEPLSWYFRHGRLKEALFAAQNAKSAVTVRALERFRLLMAGPPLHRPPFRAVEEPHTGARDLREWLPPPLDEHDVSLSLAGLGIAQMYWILGQAMLSGAAMVGVEEPEAHLHAPTTGRHLRRLLARLVDEKHVDQLFIATHSNLFDLDRTGFFDVRLENGETRVEKKPLDAIDAHLYEPGPTLHALEELLAVAPADKVMFRGPDGAPVTAREMVTLLRDGDPLALDYLRNLHAAAVDVVGLRSRRRAP
jgi:hypothetical protein